MAATAAATTGRAVRGSLGAQRLAALFAAGALMFNFPLLALWDPESSLFGIPLLPAALFGVWALLIAASGWITERIDDPARAADDSRPGTGAHPPGDDDRGG